jgi:hypothetical protein
MAEPGTLPCPHCGGDLKFDIHDRKLHCQSCRKIWSYKIDFEKGKIVWSEWWATELTEREMQELQKGEAC